jgi:hypothetical protein
VLRRGAGWRVGVGGAGQGRAQGPVACPVWGLRGGHRQSWQGRLTGACQVRARGPRGGRLWGGAELHVARACMHRSLSCVCRCWGRGSAASACRTASMARAAGSSQVLYSRPGRRSNGPLRRFSRDAHGVDGGARGGGDACGPVGCGWRRRAWSSSSRVQTGGDAVRGACAPLRPPRVLKHAPPSRPEACACLASGISSSRPGVTGCAWPMSPATRGPCLHARVARVCIYPWPVSACTRGPCLHARAALVSRMAFSLRAGWSGLICDPSPGPG